MPGTKPSLRRLAQSRRVSRRRILALVLGGLILTACQKEKIVYVTRPDPTSEPSAQPAPPATPAAAPTERPQPTVVAPHQGQGSVGLAPILVSPAMAAQSQVIPALDHPHPYTNRAQMPDRLQIPGIDLDAKVVPIGTKRDDKGHILWETAAFAVGYHKGTGLPGENGNIVLSGHISSPREGAVFSKLPKVEVGDGVVVSSSDRQFLFVVASAKVVTPDAVEVLDQTDHSVLTMITCVPDGVYSHRLVVRAEAV
ncbi:MAG: sortase [Chloroflexi bacterium]|nr:sortase [Chloroflexota bacterium]